MTSGFHLWEISLGTIALFLGGGVGVFAQAPQTNSDQQNKLPEESDMVRFAMQIRRVPFKGLDMEGETSWNTTMAVRGGVLTAIYSPEPHHRFRVQAFFCKGDVFKASGQDATILGASETAADFYEANTSFVSFDGHNVLACWTNRQSFKISPTNRPEVKVVTSHSRAIRHMSNWMQFLNSAGEAERAADFFATMLKEERRNLAELALKEDHSDELAALQLSDELLPRKDFLPASSLSGDQRAAVREYLEAAVQSREKLKVLAPDLAKDIPRDRELLQQYR